MMNAFLITMVIVTNHDTTIEEIKSKIKEDLECYGVHIEKLIIK